VKHDGYRMLVIRGNDRVRLLTRNGTDWTKRCPWIAEAALKNRQKHFVVDGEAVILGLDGISDFNALHSRKHEHEVQLYAFDVTSGSSHCTCARQPRTPVAGPTERHGTVVQRRPAVRPHRRYRRWTSADLTARGSR
jgi:hypothetical protein